jgi:hypothetical protein
MSKELLTPGMFVAIGLESNKCLIGEVEDIDERWIQITLKDFVTGDYCGPNVLIPRSKILQIQTAGPVVNGVVDDEHLGFFQTAWHEAHSE